MKNLRSRFDRFCYRNRNKGIPNLMLYLCLGSGLVALITLMTHNPVLYSVLVFDRDLILQGQVWRLISYCLTYSSSGILFTLIGLLCFFSLGRAVENRWGTLRFNLFYLTGIVMMDVYSMIFGCQANVLYLNLSLVLSYSTLYPDAQFLLFYIIPVRAWILALLDLVLILIGVFTPQFTMQNLFPLVALANYFLFFGKEALNLLPVSWRANARRLGRKATGTGKQAKTIPFPTAGSYEATTATVKAPYTHKCTVCGRTDVSNPELEFRYCSKCKGYYCYCQDHINNHVHIQ